MKSKIKFIVVRMLSAIFQWVLAIAGVYHQRK